MKKATRCIFNGTLVGVNGTNLHYTEADASQFLGMTERVSVFVKCGPKIGTFTNAVFQPQTSPDGQTWIDLGSSLGTVTPNTTDETVNLWKLDGTVTPASDRVRIKVTTTSTAAGTVKCEIWATMRDDS